MVRRHVLLTAAGDGGAATWVAPSAAHWLVGPFDNIFQPEGRKASVAINWGLAAALYALAGSLIARALCR